MKPAVSPYYPPRAGCSRYFFKGCDAVRFALQRMQLISDVDIPPTPAGFVTNCLVPGFGFRMAGWDQMARIALGCWIGAFLTYFVFNGRGASTFAFGLMMSIHATSVVCAISRVWPQRLLILRLLIAFTTAVALYCTAYGPALSLLGRSLIMPVWSHGGLYVINRTSWGQELQRGNLVAYRLHARGDNIRVREGHGMDAVIGLPGDVVDFTKSEYRVNGTPRPKQPGMPNAGSVTVPKDCWLVWPTLNESMYGTMHPSQVAEAKVDIGTIPKEDILGKPIGINLWRTKNQ